MFRPLRSTVVTRFPATMGLSDSRQEPAQVIYSLEPFSLLWVSQVPRPIFPRALPPFTPSSPTTAPARCFVAGAGFIFLRQTGHCYMCNEAVSGSRFKHCGSRVRLARLRQQNYSRPRLLGYLSNGQLTRYPPFRNIRSARLFLALQRHEGHEVSAVKSLPSCSPSRIQDTSLSDVVAKGNRIVGKSHSLDAVRGLTTSYRLRHFDCP